MIEFIIFAALAWFVITMMKDLMRISEQKSIEKSKKEARVAKEAARAVADAARAEARAKAKAERAAMAAAAESMVSCAICGAHIPKDEAIATQGQFYCSEAHFLERSKTPPPVVETTAAEAAEPVPQDT
jgi:septal ring factor EnvC (AmiA/AmiB activator)